jgi:hypothetical protein
MLDIARQRCAVENGMRQILLLSIRVWAFVSVMVFSSALATAQTAIVTHNVNLRPEQSSQVAPIRLLTPSEPPMELLEPHVQDGYYHVKTSAGEEGYVWSRYVTVSAAEPSAAPAAPPPAALPGAPPRAPGTPAGTTTIHLGPGVPGSANMVGCGDGRWQHVYNPTRLVVKQDCLTVTGVIVDATATQSHHQPDGVRHEGDGDTHGWLKVDPMFASLINAGNTSDEGGNLVFEIVCHYSVTQTDAKSACAGFTDHTKIPAVGQHVAITGTFVQEKNHKKWNEIHPVSSIKVQ